MNSLYIVLSVIVCFVVPFNALPIENVAKQQEQLHTALPAVLTPVDLPAADVPNQSIMALVPISLLDAETVEQAPSVESSSRSTRGLGLLALGGLGGLGGHGNFGGLGGLKGGFGGLGLGGGLHGLGGGLHGLGGFNPFFGKFHG